MKIILAAMLFIACTSATVKNTNQMKTEDETTAATKTIYDFKIKSLDGGVIDFSKYKGNLKREGQ